MVFKYNLELTIPASISLDHELKNLTLADTNYNHIYLMAGVIDNNATIGYLESMVNKEYTNTKMR